jgi:hypothetical protein
MIPECDRAGTEAIVQQSVFAMSRSCFVLGPFSGFWPTSSGAEPTAMMAAVQTLAPSLRPDQSVGPAPSVGEKPS